VVGRTLGEDDPDQLFSSVFVVTPEYDIDGGRVAEHTPIDLRPFATGALPRDPSERIVQMLDRLVRATGESTQALRSLER
jgi:hypothetical protein